MFRNAVVLNWFLTVFVVFF